MKKIRRLSAILLLAGCAVAAGPSQAASGALGIDDARHLLERTGYAADLAQVRDYAQLTRGEAVDRLLAQAGNPARTPPPQWVGEPLVLPRELRAMSDEERKAYRREQVRRSIELRGWWLREMLDTPSPLTERMTLFWHNHFVSSQQKVRYPQLMYRQNLLLRHDALGNFAELLHAVSKNPAMEIYLDSVSNRKARPNENFAREVMELFTLGEGHYTEQDVKEAARAFTGWSIDRESGEFLFRRRQHDDGVKTVLGQTGNFDGDAVLDILLAQPQTAEFIVAKLWREFVSPEPDPREVRRIAGIFRAGGYEVKAALRALLTSDAFYAPQNRAALVKSPVDLIVGTLREFHFTTGDLIPFVLASAQFGQNLFSPPNVKGWPGGDAWINSSTLLARKTFLDRLFRADEMRPRLTAMANAGGMESRANVPGAQPKGPGRLGAEGRARLMRALADLHFDSRAWLAQFSGDTGQVQRLLLATAPVNPPQPGVQGLELIRQLTQDPAYQLK